MEIFGGKAREVELEEETSIWDLLGLLGDTPARRKEIFNDVGELSSEVIVLNNGRNIQFLNGILNE